MLRFFSFPLFLIVSIFCATLALAADDCPGGKCVNGVCVLDSKPTVEPANPHATRADGWGLTLTVAGVLSALGGFMLTKRRHAVALAIICCGFGMTGCVRFSPPASMDDLQKVRDDSVKAADTQHDVYVDALAKGKPVQDATLAAFTANAQTHHDTAESAKTDPGSLTGSLIELIAVIFGGGATGTFLTRLLRGSPLRSGSGATTTVAKSSPAVADATPKV